MQEFDIIKAFVVTTFVFCVNLSATHNITQILKVGKAKSYGIYYNPEGVKIMNVALFICVVTFILIGIIVLALFIAVLFKREGSKKLIVLSFLLETILGCYIQFGFDFAVTNIPVFVNRIVAGEKVEEVFSERSIEMANHIHAISRTENENVVEATCTDSGLYDKVTYCECGQELSRETITVNPLGHNYQTTVTQPTCTENGYTTHICVRCQDTFQDNRLDPLGHNFIDGICTRCGYKDPDYIKVYSGEEIMQVLSASVVANSGTYKSYLGDESISVFAREQYNCFSINTGASYNMWGYGTQSVVFNVTDLNEIDTLHFKIGGNTGASGHMTVNIYVDKTMDGDADYSYDLEASAIPTDVAINIKGATSLAFLVVNHAGSENRLVFFDFSEVK